MATYSSPQSYLKAQVVRRSVTIDLAGSAGSLADGVPVSFNLLDADLNLLKTVSGVTAGVGSSTFVGLVFSLTQLFADYDGSKDTIEFVLTTASSITWGENGVGPRVLRYDSTYATSNDVQTFRNTAGTDRLIGINITGASAAVYVNAGTYDARSISGSFSPGATVGGWTDATPGTRDTMAEVQSRRAAVYSATQTDAGLLSLSSADPFAVFLQSIVGAKTTTVSQGATGITLTSGTTSMTARYLHVSHSRGQ